MRQRILVAIVALTSLAVVVFGAPLALSLRIQYRKEAVLRLQREATRAALFVPFDFATGADPLELPGTSDGSELALYGTNGSRVLGQGPDQADRATIAALGGAISQSGEADGPVIGVPIIGNEQVMGALRAGLPESDIEDRVLRAWLAMTALGGGAVLLSAAIGLGVSRRISRPVLALADTARRLGEGDFSARAASSKVEEVDALGQAMNITAARLGRILDRERAFSSDASHQLRTPIAAVRLRLEAAQLDPSADSGVAIAGALVDLDRLQATVEDLLALARDVASDREILDVSALVDDIDAAYHGLLAARGRPLRCVVEPRLPDVRASSSAVRQVLNVLISNAVEHGGGTVTLRARPAPGGLALEVGDEGLGITGDPSTVFRRRRAAEHGRGIGLALARSLAEAEGARLTLVHAGPKPVFALLLSERSEDGQPADPSGE